MFARVCCATGWTWDYVGEYLDLPRLYALQKYWESVPPIAEMIAIYLGVTKPGTKPGIKPSAPAKLLSNEDILAMIGDVDMYRGLDWQNVRN
jgi:hypothetical protein